MLAHCVWEYRVIKQFGELTLNIDIPCGLAFPLRSIYRCALKEMHNDTHSIICDSPNFDCEDHNKLWKILKEMGISDHLTCLLRNLYAGQDATVRTGLGTTDWLQIGKQVHQGCILSPCLFNLYAEYIM